uniref:Uncharacterized protein n=1 Tax=Oryza glumipatula TaxID=40148 RepID=A0A0E0A9A3_9ORYZ
MALGKKKSPFRPNRKPARAQDALSLALVRVRRRSLRWIQLRLTLRSAYAGALPRPRPAAAASARPPCPAAVTGGTWRRLAAGPDGVVVQAGSLSPARGGGRAAPAAPHVPISAASTPRWISAFEPASRARTSRPPTSSPARGDTAARLRPGYESLVVEFVENATPFPVPTRCLWKCPAVWDDAES